MELSSAKLKKLIIFQNVFLVFQEKTWKTPKIEKKPRKIALKKFLIVLLTYPNEC